MDKIKLNLFNLKSKEDLIQVRDFFSKNILRWFNEDKTPKEKYFEIRVCPLCESKESDEVFMIENFSYHKCSNCNSLYTKPHLKDGVLDALYNDGTYQVYQDSLVKKGSTIRKGVLERRKFKQIAQLLDKPEISLLDVGCGGGTFLEVCKENSWKVEGVDPSRESLKKDISIIIGDFNTLDFDKKYDVITFWGVLEHLFDPISALSKANKMLTKGGLLIFEVPSADSFLSEYLKKYDFSPTRYIESGRHNIFFSQKLIEKVAKHEGLGVELIESNGLDIQTIILEEFDETTTDKIINIQDILNDLLLGDHYRVFLRKK
mgnify:CR=1 FL=1|tara:strand:- start:3118 stop:4071 length:954 start_codon:yes stop_codon:yes gene_type:complete